MQKLAKRTAQAQRQAARHGQKYMEARNVDDRIRNRQALKATVAEINQNLQDARRARKEDWEMGPIAPKRDLGYNHHGSFRDNVRLNWTNSGLNTPRPEVVEKRCAWAGGPKQLNLAIGDRVLIMDGPDKGKVDRIRTLIQAQGTVTLESRHKSISVGMFGENGRAESLPISIASIRLVYPLTNPDTGVTRDVVINQLKSVPPNMQSPNMSLDRWHHGNKWDRLVPGLNVVIPWPAVEAPEREMTAGDTSREQVEDRSFFYNLLSPPMPESVLDELRNKYSRFRTRHEQWYVERKEAEAAAKVREAESVRAMQTPLDEFHEAQRELRAVRGEPELSDEMLEKLGAFMAKKKEVALSQAGVTQVSEDKSGPSS